MTVELVFACGITVYAITLMICICACLANYRAGVRDGIGYLRDPQDHRYKDAGDLIDAEGLANWLRIERLSVRPTIERCDKNASCRKGLPHHPSKDSD